MHRSSLYRQKQKGKTIHTCIDAQSTARSHIHRRNRRKCADQHKKEKRKEEAPHTKGKAKGKMKKLLDTHCALFQQQIEAPCRDHGDQNKRANGAGVRWAGNENTQPLERDRGRGK